MRVAGIMSGTSLDGIDVAIVDIQGRGWSKRIRTVAFYTVPYSKRVREALLRVSNATAHTGEVSRLNVLLAELYARALAATCHDHGVLPESIDLIGCHGQTIFHEGQAAWYLGERIASTLQIGDGCVLAERTGRPVISDFRMRDMAAGGRGAPLVPYVDYLLYRHPAKTRIALNIGGIANLTLIPAGAQPEQVVAFDTGPGNMVIDGLIARFSGGRRRFDENGGMGAAGRVQPDLLGVLMRDAYFRKKPPKTAGREQYGDAFLDRFTEKPMAPVDVLATATALTAVSIRLAVDRFCVPPEEVIVSGGGVHNLTLMAMLTEELRPARVLLSSKLGINPDAKEAVAFAVLAYESWHGRSGNLPSATGARHGVPLGKLSRASAASTL